VQLGALTGLTFHDLRGVRFQQGIDTVKLMQSVAPYNEEVTGPKHALIIGDRACRMALAERGVAHLTVSKDLQMMKLAADNVRCAIRECARFSRAFLVCAVRHRRRRALFDLLRPCQEVAHAELAAASDRCKSEE
jgi:hypothetical protein